MGSGGQIVHTICMQTLDAIKREEGEFTMRLGGDNPRLRAVKVMLGSLEFPMVQWTIEKDWNRLYFSEGYKLTNDNSFLSIDEKTTTVNNTINIRLPMYLNPIEEIVRQGNFIIIKTEYPHGLWLEAKRSTIHGIKWGSVDIICSPMGRVSLTQLIWNKQMEYLSEYEFIIPCPLDVNTSLFCGYVYTPTIPSPHHLCELLTYCLLYAQTLSSYSVEYCSAENKAVLQANIYPEDTDSLIITLHGSKLAKILGYGSSLHTKRFQRKLIQDNHIEVVQRFDNVETHDTPLILPSEQFSGWMCTTIEPGWYIPSNRPMCNGNPLRMPQELEGSLNRFYFPIPERIPHGLSTSHFLVFADPSGKTQMCPVYVGKYNIETLCMYLENEMTRISSRNLTGTVFSVSYDTNIQRIIISCEVRSNSMVTPAPFSLLFNHPAQFDPCKLGFGPYPLHGSDTYTSNELVLPKFDGKMHSNIYRISEISHQKKFRFQGSPVPHITAIITEYNNQTSELILKTYVGQLPYAHGFIENDVVSIGPASDSELFEYSIEQGQWVLSEYSPCPLAANWGRSGVVLKNDVADTHNNNTPYTDHIFMRLKVKNTPSLSGYYGTVVTIQSDPEPFNLCFNLPKSISNTSLGFNYGACQWGIDGSVNNGIANLPPIDAPNVHNLDHPDYILMYITEGKKNLGLQHSFKSDNRSPFAKLVLYPMFREERMLPRDTTLLGSESLSTFTIKFTNPDGSPYHFHGANFSFSLNFVEVVEK